MASGRIMFTRQKSSHAGPPVLLTKRSSMVANPILTSTRQQHPSLSRVQTSTHYLTVSSETSTFTEIEGDDLVDIDYISEYSLDLSNDEDEEENYEDIQSEMYLRNLFYTIDRLTFDDLTKDDSPSTSFALIELPKNLIVECHVWRQKFKFKKAAPKKAQRGSQRGLAVPRPRVRPRRRSSTEQAIISKVIDWNEENTLTTTNLPNLSSLKPLEVVSSEAKENVERPLLKMPKTPSNAWMQQVVQSVKPHLQVQTSSTTAASRITLPPLINPKRPQSNELLGAVTTTGLIFSKMKLEFQPKEENRQSSSLFHQHQQQPYSGKQLKQSYPLQTSQSFSEQSECSSVEKNNNTMYSNSGTNRASASSSYARITLDDLLDQTAGASGGSVWSHRSSVRQLAKSNMLKLPAIES